MNYEWLDDDAEWTAAVKAALVGQESLPPPQKSPEELQAERAERADWKEWQEQCLRSSIRTQELIVRHKEMMIQEMRLEGWPEPVPTWELGLAQRELEELQQELEEFLDPQEPPPDFFSGPS